MEWQAPAVVLSARPFGEGSVVVTVLTEAEGRHAGLVRGGAGRAQAATWLVGNLIEARWVARLAEQLGSLTGELVHPAAALAMEDPLALALLASACAVADGALAERAAQPAVFGGLVRLLLRLPQGAERLIADYIRWEVMMLAELGYGLDLARCAVTGEAEGLAFVSPRTGRAVTEAAARPWRERLLPLPGFLLAPERERANDPAGPTDWAAGLRLTGHFLARDAFGQFGRSLPQPRQSLADRIAAMARA
jgi:DNA repair protein RecO (recombination protein O)